MNNKTSEIRSKNKIKDILFKRGFKQITPTDELLNSLDLTLHRFNKIIDNKVEVTAGELVSFSSWLNVPIQQLIFSIDEKKCAVESAFNN